MQRVYCVMVKLVGLKVSLIEVALVTVKLFDSNSSCTKLQRVLCHGQIGWPKVTIDWGTLSQIVRTPVQISNYRVKLFDLSWQHQDTDTQEKQAVMASE